jgi:hypothetical protein
MSTQQTELDTMRDTVSRVLWPPQQRRDALAVARRVAGVVTVVGTLVQIVVWLVIAAFSGGPDSPWWLISAVGAATLAVSLWVVDEHGVGLGLREDGNAR